MVDEQTNPVIVWLEILFSPGGVSEQPGRRAGPESRPREPVGYSGGILQWDTIETERGYCKFIKRYSL